MTTEDRKVIIKILWQVLGAVCGVLFVIGGTFAQITYKEINEIKRDLNERSGLIIKLQANQESIIFRLNKMDAKLDKLIGFQYDEQHEEK